LGIEKLERRRAAGGFDHIEALRFEVGPYELPQWLLVVYEHDSRIAHGATIPET
jgi:hypothetical protein